MLIQVIGETRRIFFLTTVVALGAVVIATRLFYLQVAMGSHYYNLADTQYTAGGQYSLYERGSIYFSNKDGGQIGAAGLESGFILAINPSLIVEGNEVIYEKLLSIIPGISKEQFLIRAEKNTDPYEEIAHRLTLQQKNKIEELDIKGIILVKEQWRTYPADNLASQVIGFVGFNEDEFVGRYGIEREYESVLSRSTNGLYNNFFTGILDGVKKDFFGEERDRDGDVILTIEPKVQALVESKLEELISNWTPRKVGIMVIDPKTGEIMAMAARPSFDPNNLKDETDPEVFSNPFVEDVFEMGSIMKPITIASALDAGVIKSSTTYLDKGFIELDGKRISNFDGKGRGLASMQDVLNQSLNTGATFAALSLGPNRFREYMYRFGYQDKTGIDLPQETGNLIENLESNKEVEIATASFGQGIAVSPISITRALSALGNGGYLIKPHVTRSIDYTLGYSDGIKVTDQGRAISREASDEITRMLVKVVDEYLANGGLKMEHYSIAAKTGTAQIANPDGGGYYTDRYTHSFFGYFPAYNPRFLIFLFMTEPVGANYASQTLTEPFRDITKFLISYYDIPPDR